MIAERDHGAVGFTAQNGLKDARLVCAAGAAGGLQPDALPIAVLARQRLEALVESGGAGRDWSAAFALPSRE
jgi:hypothetical protein